MTTIEIIATGTGILGAGAYLRWAISPVLIAYRVGRCAAAWRKPGS